MSPSMASEKPHLAWGGSVGPEATKSRGVGAVMICDLFLLFEVAREKPNQLSVEVPKALSPRWRVVAQVTHDRRGKPRL